MEVKQSEIRQKMEPKLKNICEQTQEKYQRNVKLMQEEYKRKLKQEIQRYISTETSTFGQRKALETAKQMLHQTRGESKSPEMDWDYYGVHAGE